jgi:ATP-dependent helicase HrpA
MRAGTRRLILLGTRSPVKDIAARLDQTARSGEAVRDIRWQIEELRVSLFAQTIGTPLPVSERRVMTAIEHLN